MEDTGSYYCDWIQFIFQEALCIFEQQIKCNSSKKICVPYFVLIYNTLN